MNISDIKDGMRKVDVEGEVASLGSPRTVNLKAGGTATTVEAIIQDSTGKCKLSLWDAQVNQVKQGNKIRVSNGYTNSYKGEVRLNIGRYGNLEVLN